MLGHQALMAIEIGIVGLRISHIGIGSIHSLLGGHTCVEVVVGEVEEVALLLLLLLLLLVA